MMTAILLVAFMGVAQAGDVLIKDRYGNLVYTINEEGVIKDRHGSSHGYVKDGWLKDNNGFNLYEIVTDEDDEKD